MSLVKTFCAACVVSSGEALYFIELFYTHMCLLLHVLTTVSDIYCYWMCWPLWVIFSIEWHLTPMFKWNSMCTFLVIIDNDCHRVMNQTYCKMFHLHCIKISEGNWWVNFKCGFDYIIEITILSNRLNNMVVNKLWYWSKQLLFSA